MNKSKKGDGVRAPKRKTVLLDSMRLLDFDDLAKGEGGEAGCGEVILAVLRRAWNDDAPPPEFKTVEAFCLFKSMMNVIRNNWAAYDEESKVKSDRARVQHAEARAETEGVLNAE